MNNRCKQIMYLPKISKWIASTLKSNAYTHVRVHTHLYIYTYKTVNIHTLTCGLT